MITARKLEEAIKDSDNTVRVTIEPLGVDETLWIVEGDLAIEESRIASYAAERVALAEHVSADPESAPRGLVAIERDGKILRWQRGKVLDYCVWRPSFQDEDEYQAVVRAMTIATEDWSAICGVRFAHRADKDSDEQLQFGDVLFPVVRCQGGGNTLAVAFFPDHAMKKRMVRVFDGFFRDFGPDSFTHEGILRHELGHVLGFRHEHIRPEAPELWNPEDTSQTWNLGAYDPSSVMHYVRDGFGDPGLHFTDSDREGAVRVYGRPDADFRFEP